MTEVGLARSPGAVAAGGPHTRAEAFFSDVLDGEIAPAERTWFDDHLRACDGCRARYARFSGPVALVRTDPRPRAPPGLLRKVLARLRAGRRRRAARALDHSLFAEIAAAGAVAALAAALVLWFVVFGP